MGKNLITLLVCVQLIIVGADYQVVQISNGLKLGELIVNCHSDENKDMGKRVLKPRESFSWGFDISIGLCFDGFICGGNSCDFSWNNKNASFLVWGGVEALSCSIEGKGEWSVREDGFYFRCLRHDWHFIFSWPR